MIVPGIIAKEAAGEPRRQLAQIRAAGFEYLSLHAGAGDRLLEELSLYKEEGLSVKALFAPYGGINAVWRPGDRGDALIGELQNLLCEGSRCGIGQMILRVTEDEAPADITQVGLDRFRRLADFAREREVRLAFENRQNEDFLRIILAVCDSYHGFCWNVGNQTADPLGVDYLAQHGDRLQAVRLSDVKETADGYMRTLPGDGDTDWQTVARQLGALGYDGPVFTDTYLQWELYGGLSYSAFLALAYERTREILEDIQRSSSCA